MSACSLLDSFSTFPLVRFFATIPKQGSGFGQSVISFPRLLMEQKLGRPLDADEQVHHIDENPSNNDFDNLEVIKLGEHQKIHTIEKNRQNGYKNENSFHDIVAICQECGKSFVWSAHSQLRRYQNRNRGYVGLPFCSRHCVGVHNQREQMRRKAQAECQ